MRQFFSRPFHAIGTLVVLLTASSAVHAVTQQGDPGTVRFFFRQGPSFDSYTDNATTQQKQAMNQDFWQAEEFHPAFDAMTSWYPKALDYMDSLAIYVDNNPNMSWVIRDINGEPLYINFGCNVSAETCTQYAADITNTSPSGFRAWWISQAQQLPSFGYIGLWIDDVNLYKDSSEINLVHADGTHGIPVDSNTGLEMTQDQWNSYMAGWMQQIRAAMPSSEILQNTMWYAGNGNPGTDPNVVNQIKASDLINIEGGVCDSGLTGGTGFWSIGNLFTYIDQVHNLGKGVVLDNNSKCAAAQEEYTLAGYFMISNGTDATSFPNVVPITNWWNGFNVSMGAPSGARYHRGTSTTLWERDYANGLVLLNEPSAPTVTVTLPKSYLRVDGSTVTSVTLTALEGAVLTNISSGSPVPVIGLNTHALSFTAVSGGSNPSNQSLTLTNTGASGSTLAWTAASSASWLGLSSLSGSLSSGSNSSLSVSINTSGLSVGSHTGTLTFTASGASNSPQTVTVTLMITAPVPTISLTPTTFSASGVSGGPNPPSQTLTLKNSGAAGSILGWSATSSVSWLSLSQTNGSITSGSSSALTVSFNSAGLSVGTHTGTLTFTASGASNTPQTVSVTFTVTAPVPTISLTPTTLSATSVSGGASPASQTVTLKNSGGSGSTLNWTASSNASWLSLSSTSGSLAGGSSSALSVSFNSAGLSVGSHTGTLTFNGSGASNNPQTISATLTVTAAPEAAISLTPTTFAISAVSGAANPASQSLTLRNSGSAGSTLHWSATSNATWLSMTPAGGSLGAGASSTESIAFNISGLAPNTYTGTISVADPAATNSPQKVAVSLTLTAPSATIALSPTVLGFTGTVGQTPSSQTFSIRNSGPAGSTLSWSIGSSQSWLIFSPGTGSLPAGASATVNVSVNTSGLSSGTHAATLSIFGSGATNSPQTVAVNVTLNPAAVPVLAVSPAILNYATSAGGPSPLAQTIVISNTGTGTLNWTAADLGLGWLNLSKTSGALTAGANVSVSASVDTSALSSGSYSDLITVTDASGNAKQIQVTVTISDTASAVLSVDNQDLSFATVTGAPALTQTISLTNGGPSGTTLNWTSNSDSFWLSVSPDHGTLASNQVATLTITATPGSLTPASYDGAITLSDPQSANGNLIVDVSLDLNDNASVGGPLPAPDLNALPSSIPVNGTLSIGNAAAYSNVSFYWGFSSAGAAPAAALSAVARAPSSSFKSGASASLANASLTPGYYVVSVYAADNTNNSVVSPTTSKDITLVSDDLTDARVYPNPWRSDKHMGHPMMFDHLSLNSNVKIYTVSGHLVKRLDATSGSAQWDLMTDDGSSAASGIYLYLITNSQGEKTKGRVVIIR